MYAFCWILLNIRTSLDEYSLELQKVTICLLKMMARNLGLQPENFATLFDDGVQGIRMNYYPPCKQANKVMGLTPHSDATGLTILVQVNEVHGLQIKRNGKWVPIKPIPGAFIINIGDIIEVKILVHEYAKDFKIIFCPQNQK